MNKSISYFRVPVLDKTSPTVEQLETGVRWAQDQIGNGRNIYVHCGAGHERSAVFVAVILLKTEKCKTLTEAIEFIQPNRQKARFVGNQQMILEQWLMENQ